MSIFTITPDKSNKDIPKGMSNEQAKSYYLSLFGDFKGRMPDPTVEAFEDKWVFRADLAPAGLKAFGAEKVIAEAKEDVLVYCAPRVGHAPDAIATLAKMYDKKCVFFCPAAAQASKHQAVLKARGADLRFIKIAAMPTLNVYAKRWAEKHGALFLPFGLTGVPTVTAGLVNAATNISRQLGKDPSQVWMAVSTGTAIRAFQIAWPYSSAHGVAVARNIHDGEVGNAVLRSASVPFLRPVKNEELPYFQTTATYDAKAWSDFIIFGATDSIFINVGADAEIEKYLYNGLIESIDSQREWGDMRDYERGL
jgi:hypothetical protein